jgi:signal transduction histidine kinase
MKTNLQTENAKRELSRARIIIDQFINSCSHNLKGPLTSIEGLVMIAEYCTNPGEVNQCLGLIQQCTVNMLEMIRKLEEYTTNIQRDLRYDEIEVDQLLGRVLAEYSQEITQKKIAISTKVFQSQKWVADEHCNYLILKNLISNAIHFCNPGEKLKKVHVDVAVRADQVKVEVTDNGIGIPQPEQQKIFEPFHRCSNRSNGNGLGLFLVKGLMDKLKASISINSNENFGTSFFLSMPNNLAL